MIGSESHLPIKVYFLIRLQQFKVLYPTRIIFIYEATNMNSSRTLFLFSLHFSVYLNVMYANSACLCTFINNKTYINDS